MLLLHDRKSSKNLVWFWYMKQVCKKSCRPKCVCEVICLEAYVFALLDNPFLKDFLN